MRARRALLGGVIAAGLAVSGVSVSAALMDMPQDAVPVPDPVGDALRATVQAPAPRATQPTSPPAAPAAPSNTGEPGPITIIPPENEVVQEEVEDEIEEESEEARVPAPEIVEEPVEPGPRRRLPVAVVQAIDKTTAQTMRFEVEVGGRPVRFSRSLVFKVRACEVTGPGEQTEDAIAYLEIGTQPRNQANATEARQVFKGWMFASSPSVNALQHPNYDAWVIGCKN